MKKKLSKTERIMSALMAGQKLSGLTILKKFGTIKGVSRISDLQKKYFFKCEKKWQKPNKKSKGNEEYFLYWMSNEDIKRFKKILEL